MNCTLPVTGGSVTLPFIFGSVALAVGLALIVLARRRHQTAAMVAAIALLGVLAMSLAASPPAHADSNPCLSGPTTTAQEGVLATSSSVASTTTTVAVDTTTTTVMDTTTAATTTTTVPPTTTTTAPPPTGALRGRFARTGDLITFNSPPSPVDTPYTNNPGNPSFGPADPAAEWNLPTITSVTDEPIADILVTLSTAGPDTVFGSPDDVVIGTTTTGTDGTYAFTGLPDDLYLINLDGPTYPGHASAVWSYNGGFCFASVLEDPTFWFFDAAASRPRQVTVSGGAATSGIDFSTSFTMLTGGSCI